VKRFNLSRALIISHSCCSDRRREPPGVHPSRSNPESTVRGHVHGMTSTCTRRCSFPTSSPSSVNARLDATKPRLCLAIRTPARLPDREEKSEGRSAGYNVAMGGCQLVPLGFPLSASVLSRRVSLLSPLPSFPPSTNSFGRPSARCKNRRERSTTLPPPPSPSHSSLPSRRISVREILDACVSALRTRPRKCRRARIRRECREIGNEKQREAEGTAGGSLHARPYGDYPRPVLFIAATQRGTPEPRARARVARSRIAPENSGRWMDRWRERERERVS